MKSKDKIGTILKYILHVKIGELKKEIEKLEEQESNDKKHMVTIADTF